MRFAVSPRQRRAVTTAPLRTVASLPTAAALSVATPLPTAAAPFAAAPFAAPPLPSAATLLAAAALVAGAALLMPSPIAAEPQGGSLPRQLGGQRDTPQRHNGQKPDAKARPERSGGFSATVEMVRVPVVVEDGDGAFLQNLDQADFVVRDGGENHPVAHFVSDAEPVSVGILVDASAAMKPFAADLHLAVERIARNLRPDDELFLLAYGPGVATLSEPSADKETIVVAMAEYTTWDGADRALYDALDRGLETLEASRYDKRSLIVIGAGGDTASTIGELGVQQHIHRTGVTIHAISLSASPTRVRNTPSRVNRLQTLPEVARFTGGLLALRPQLLARYGGIAGFLEVAGHDITTYVKHQYLLHYAPLNPPRPGTWREIRVEVDGGHRKIRARSGYMR